jgi:hypothetical protein
MPAALARWAALAGVGGVCIEHVDIRRRIGDLETGAPVDSAAPHALGERLRDHERHEERTPFGRIEAALNAGELGAVGAALQVAGEAHRPPRA